MMGEAAHMMGVEMVFSRYEGQARERCVFTEHSTTRVRASDDFTKRFESDKFDVWEEDLEIYLGVDQDDSDRSFGLPPYQIRIKSTANDTELPNLKYDFQKREISFEWEGMFALFYHEAAALANRERSNISKADQWLDGADITLTDGLAMLQRTKQFGWCSRKEIRRKRIKDWYLENRSREFSDSLFDEEEEDRALDAIEDFELHGDFIRCAEDSESKLVAASHAAANDMMEVVGAVRGSNGFGESNEDALIAMLMRMAHGPPRDDEFDDCRMPGQRGGDDDDDEQENYEDDGPGEDDENSLTAMLMGMGTGPLIQRYDDDDDDDEEDWEDYDGQL
jgi:hypothetical protein